MEMYSLKKLGLIIKYSTKKMLERMLRKADPLLCWWECKLIQSVSMEDSMEIP